MQESSICIIFIGDPAVGKTAIINALSGKDFTDKYKHTSENVVIEERLPINANHNFSCCFVELGDYSSHLRVFCDNFKSSLVYIIVNAADPADKQCEAILRYQKFIKDRTGDKKPKVLVLANKKNEVVNKLTKDDLSSCEIDAADYSIVSAKQIADDLKADHSHIPAALYNFINAIKAEYIKVSRDSNFASSSVAPSASHFRSVSPDRSATAAASVSTPSSASARPPMR